MGDSFDLDRFVTAQAPLIDRVRAELAGCAKRTHWMWFVFPQIAGLGRSPTARFYAISGEDEARAYLGHAVLGPRLVACAELALGCAGRVSALELFGAPDDAKFRSSMTLFDAVARPDAPFARALGAFFDGGRDPRTLALLGR